MDEPRKLREALTVLADHGVGRVQAPSVDALRRRRVGRRRSIQAAAVAAAVVVIAGTTAAVMTSRNIGSPAVPPPAPSTSTSTGTAGSTTVTGSPTTSASGAPAQRSGTATPTRLAAKQLARTETNRLLTLFTIPSSAVRLTSAPQALPGPAMGTPQSDSLIDTTQYWTVPMSLAQATDWVGAHPPQGLKSAGSSHFASHGDVSGTGFEFDDDHTSSAWTNANLQISVAANGTAGTYWRIDAMALWRTATPVTDTGRGARLTVTVAGGCPAGDLGVHDVPAGPPGSSQTLLPTDLGRPTSGLVCAYSGGGGNPFALTQHRRIGRTDAAALARLANAIDLSHTSGGTFSCPSEDGAATVLAFTYPGGTDAELWLADSGCPSISNGTITAQTAGGDSAGVAPLSTAVGRLLHH